jgi:hypothetical protein
MRFVEGGRPVKLAPLEAGYHLFLSHAQDSGADQVATIKYLLEKHVPEIQVFLDVETLEAVGDLELLVSRLRVLVVLLVTRLQV